ncbi:MAG: family 10 glycosylhydrolase [Muribaculaceae bacterium]|nr:family 10 glycosylhydrolase [Muribaculaceae bacterium]
MKAIKLLMPALAALVALGSVAQNPKREFRGAWMHIIGQKQYAMQSTAENQAYLIDQLDKLEAAGINAIVWQIRPQADAAYVSKLEPWSRWISGEAGKAPNPMWDPLQFMIDEAHKRGMELHAWINPYRVTSDKNDKPAPGHIYYEHPEWFLKYADGKIYFDPGLPECRDFIDKVVRDIITRYDVDAIHMDDYFYPYPVEGVDFPDDASYAKYGQGWDRGDWRRANVDKLIEKLHNTLVELKPWVQFGISPFGVWRNKTDDVNGSDTRALQCYDKLYADCPRWTALGWVDYMVPQLYWELDHPRANCLTLTHWWDQHANGRHMYIGTSVNNVMDHRDIAAENGDTLNPTQLDHRTRINRECKYIQGPCWWPAYSITRNYKGVMDSLQTTHQSTPALIQPYRWIDVKAPEAVKNLTISSTKTEVTLMWEAPATTDPMQQAVRYVVYRVKQGEPLDIENSNNILKITGMKSLKIPVDKKDKTKWVYAVTAVDRCNNESQPTTIQ